jgi:hypothetical protein
MTRALALALLPAIVLVQEADPRWQATRLQVGMEAFRRHDYQTAASYLRAYAFDNDPQFAEPAVQFALGVMYDRGAGVAPDPLMACVFYDLGRRATAREITPDKIVLETLAAEAYDQSGCGGRTEREKWEIGQLMSCFREWPPAVTFDFGEQRWASVDRLEITIHAGSEQSASPLPLDGCQAVVLPLAHERVDGRDFLHYFYWTSGGARGAHSMHALHWAAFEVRGTALKMVTDSELQQTSDLTMPTAELTPALRELAKFGMNAAGEVEWSLATTPPRRGVAPR